MPVRDVLIGERRIRYAEAGDGPALVLLHGGWADHRIWRPQLEGLSDDFAVAAWDAPGCGRSFDPPAGWGMAEYADCLAAWLRSVGIERPHVLGLSWGGTLALELYRRHPQVPASLVLAGAYAGWAGSLPSEVVSSARSRSSSGRPRSGSRATSPVSSRARRLRASPGSEIPTLLLYGELDRRSPLAVAEELHRSIPGSRLAVLPGVGHLASAERPEEFNAAVRVFLPGL